MARPLPDETAGAGALPVVLVRAVSGMVSLFIYVCVCVCVLVLVYIALPSLAR